MRIDDLADGHADAGVPCDVLLIGSGPAGLTIARELAGTGLDVVVLESGGMREEASADALNEIESVGAARVLEQRLVRNRVLGGTSATWSGRSVVLDPLDFAARRWVPDSGWPVARNELLPYFARSMDHLGAPVADNLDPAFVAEVGRGVPLPDPQLLIPYAWALSRDVADPGSSMRFGPRAAAMPLPGVRCVLHATVTEVLVAADGLTAEGVVATAPDGTAYRFTAAAVVLAGGAIENARLLLASDRVVRGGVGNGEDLVGRYLMDHLRGPVAVFPRAAHARVQRIFRDRYLPGPARATPGWALAPALQEREALLNCALWAFPVVAPDDPFTALGAARSSARSAAAAAAAIGAHPALVAEGALALRAGTRPPVRLLSRLELHAIVEQRPDRDSRVTLSSRRDALGLPLSRIDWHVSEQEERTVRRATALAIEALDRAGLPRPTPTAAIAAASGPIGLPDVAHPIGTTRMSADPRSGVVDAQCRVHGSPNLYVAGSSVFPTSAHANPTQMIVALAVRLADQLRAQVRPRV